MPHELVSISIKYPSQEQADVKVDPEEVTIYYNRNGDSGDPKLARQVEWKVSDEKAGDRVVIRPKGSLDPSTKAIFKPPAGKKHFEATSKEPAIDCGTPEFDVVPKPLHIAWEYEAVVIRAGKEIGDCDPTILIEEDP